MFKAIAIRNPLILDRIHEEQSHGAGRNLTEVAENLILTESERRRIERASGDLHPRKPSNRKQSA